VRGDSRRRSGRPSSDSDMNGMRCYYRSVPTDNRARRNGDRGRRKVVTLAGNRARQPSEEWNVKVTSSLFQLDSLAWIFLRLVIANQTPSRPKLQIESATRRFGCFIGPQSALLEMLMLCHHRAIVRRVIL